MLCMTKGLASLHAGTGCLAMHGCALRSVDCAARLLERARWVTDGMPAPAAGIATALRSEAVADFDTISRPMPSLKQIKATAGPRRPPWRHAGHQYCMDVALSTRDTC